jgi:hypothetical protein
MTTWYLESSETARDTNLCLPLAALSFHRKSRPAGPGVPCATSSPQDGRGPGRETTRLSSLANPHAKANKIVAPSVRFAMPVFTAGVEDDAGSCQCCLWLRQPDVPKNSTRVDQDTRIKEDTSTSIQRTILHLQKSDGSSI